MPLASRQAKVPRRSWQRASPLFASGALLLMAGLVSAGSTTVLFTDFSDTTLLQINGNAATAVAGSVTVLRLTPAAGGQSGSAFLTDGITLEADASFSTSFEFQITGEAGGIGDGDGDGADGLAFVVQTVSNTAGGSGGGIGYEGIVNSIAIEFDTYDNGEISGNHVGLDLGGSVTSVSAVDIPTRMNDGNIWYAWIDYEGATDTLEVRLDQVNLRPVLATLTASVDVATVIGSTTAFVGFTSGTGAGWGNHDVRSWTFINDFNPVGVNGPPSADAGADATFTETSGGTSVTLDGSASTDPDGDVLTYTWTGPFAGGTATGVNPTVVFPGPGTYVVTLTVDDGNGGTATDTLQITVAAGPAPATPAPTPPTTPAPSPTPGGLPNTAASGAEATLPLLAVGLALITAVSLSRFAPAIRRSRSR
ncbi:MAG TPA: PKD domain-containing protein [Candidatus Limnocylindria bacterium]